MRIFKKRQYLSRVTSITGGAKYLISPLSVDAVVGTAADIFLIFCPCPKGRGIICLLFFVFAPFRVGASLRGYFCLSIFIEILFVRKFSFSAFGIFKSILVKMNCDVAENAFIALVSCFQKCNCFTRCFNLK